MAFILFVPLLIFYDQPVSWYAIVYWPASLALCLVATLGPGTLLAALNVKYRDFRYVIPFLVQILFFLTPVIYPISMLHHPLLKIVLAISPMYSSVELFRYPMTGAPLDTTLILISVSSGVIFLFVGLVYFRRTENFFADFA
jgi:lipopolysaccharide transport system permease protein